MFCFLEHGNVYRPFLKTKTTTMFLLSKNLSSLAVKLDHFVPWAYISSLFNSLAI